MRVDTFAKARNFSPAHTVRVAAGLGLVLMIAFAGSAGALLLGYAALHQLRRPIRAY